MKSSLSTLAVVTLVALANTASANGREGEQGEKINFCIQTAPSYPDIPAIRFLENATGGYGTLFRNALEPTEETGSLGLLCLKDGMEGETVINKRTLKGDYTDFSTLDDMKIGLEVRGTINDPSTFNAPGVINSHADDMEGCSIWVVPFMSDHAATLQMDYASTYGVTGYSLPANLPLPRERLMKSFNAIHSGHIHNTAPLILLELGTAGQKGARPIQEEIIPGRFFVSVASTPAEVTAAMQAAIATCQRGQ